MPKQPLRVSTETVRVLVHSIATVPAAYTPAIVGGQVQGQDQGHASMIRVVVETEGQCGSHCCGF